MLYLLNNKVPIQSKTNMIQDKKVTAALMNSVINLKINFDANVAKIKSSTT
jgi:hypothetical protein